MHVNEKGKKHLLLMRCGKCVPPSTVVSGHYLPIKDYAVNDECIGVSGKTLITNTFQHEYNGPMLEVRAVGLLPFKITPEHPILVVPRVRVRWPISTNYYSRTEHRMHQNTKSMWSYLEPRWKKAIELVPACSNAEGDSLVIPRTQGWVDASEVDMKQFSRTSYATKGALLRRGVHLKFQINETSAWLLGLYVAEGCTGPSAVYFNLGKHEHALIDMTLEKVRSLGYVGRMQQKRTATQVVISSRLLSRAFKTWCGPRASMKRIPDFILYHKNLNLLTAFYNGYLRGDGYSYSNDKRRSSSESMATVSKVLALQLQLLAARLGFLLSIYPRKPLTKPTVIEGRLVNVKPVYDLSRCVTTGNVKHKRAIILSDKILLPVRAVGVGNYSGPVNNLETTDHSYLVNNVVVHNCLEPVQHPNKAGDWRIRCARDGQPFFFSLGNPAIVFRALPKSDAASEALYTEEPVT